VCNKQEIKVTSRRAEATSYERISGSKNARKDRAGETGERTSLANDGCPFVGIGSYLEGLTTEKPDRRGKRGVKLMIRQKINRSCNPRADEGAEWHDYVPAEVRGSYPGTEGVCSISLIKHLAGAVRKDQRDSALHRT